MSLLVYSASAGSGKTYTLALKYISLALAGQPQEGIDNDKSFNKKYYTHILAVTFTNKATGEMKKRILEHLYDLAYNTHDKDKVGFLHDVKRETHLDEPTISYRAKEVLQCIVNDYDHFKVETIDSFFQTLLSELANELKLPRDFRVDLDDQYVIGKAVDELLLHLTEQNGEVVKAVENYLKTAIDEDNSWNIASEIKKFASKELFDSKCVEYQPELKRLKSEDIKTIRDSLVEIRKRCEQKVEELIDSNSCIKTIHNGGELDKDINRKYLSWINSYLNNLLEKEPSNSVNAIASGELDSEAAALSLEKKSANEATREQTLRIVEELRSIERLRPLLTSIYVSCDLTIKNLNALSLLKAIEEQVTQMTTNSGSILLSRTPILFNNVVSKDDASFVFERSGNTYNHIMIDEFQDTSNTQWGNFKKLLIDTQAQDYECMLVGDVKQSIYRWRGGDWNILANIENGKDKELGRQVRPMEMDTNYRSVHTIVHFNNAFFLRSAALIDGYIKSDSVLDNAELPHIGCSYFDDWQSNVAVSVSAYSSFLKSCEKSLFAENSTLPIYKNVAQKCKKDSQANPLTGYVYIETLNEESVLTNEEHAIEGSDATLAYVMNQMRQKIDLLHNEYGVAYKDMIILVRKNDEGADIVNYFSEKHWTDVKLTTEEAFLFTSSNLVCSLVYALKYLNSRINEVCPRTDKTHALNEKADNTQKDTVSLAAFKHYYNKLNDDAQMADCQAKRDQLIEMLGEDEQVKQWANTPLYELCQEIATLLNMNALANAEESGQSAYFFNFMDAVMSYIEEKESNLDSFVDYWDEKLFKKSIVDNNNDAIRILTIHKAKGLEAHTVFIPFASFDMQPTANKLPLVWCQTDGEKNVANDEAGIEEITGSFNKTASILKVAPIVLSKKAQNSIYKNDYEEEYFQQRVDALNTLYVAFTRARNNLFVWSNYPNPPKSAKDSTFYLINAFVNNEASDYDLKEKKFGIWEYGLLEKIQPKEEKKAAENKCPNPFSDSNRLESLSVSLQIGDLSHVTFLQSNDAKEFVEDKDDGVGDETAKKQQQEEYVEHGILCHRFFSMMDTESDVQQALDTLLSEGAISRSDVAELRTMAEKAFAKVRPMHWFDGTYQTFNECNVLTRDDKGNAIIRRPDRVMVSDEEVVVIDYKFGSPKEGYKEQIRFYISYLEKIFQRPVRGYIWYIWKNGSSYQEWAAAN